MLGNPRASPRTIIFITSPHLNAGRKVEKKKTAAAFSQHYKTEIKIINFEFGARITIIRITTKRKREWKKKKLRIKSFVLNKTQFFRNPFPFYDPILSFHAPVQFSPFYIFSLTKSLCGFIGHALSALLNFEATVKYVKQISRRYRANQRAVLRLLKIARHSYRISDAARGNLWNWTEQDLIAQWKWENLTPVAAT